MAENIPPDDDDTSQTATWVTGQLGKDILQDEDNYTYHQFRTILGETQRSYRCQMKRTTKCPAVASTGDQFLHYCEYLDPENKKQLMIIFMSDHGKWVLSHAEELYVDGTFGTKCENFAQIYFVMGKMAGKTAVPVVYALLPNKLTNTYKKFWEIVMENVNFEPGLPSRIMSDFEKGMQNTLKTSFPHAELLGCNFHFKSAVKKNVDTKGNNGRIFCTL